MAMTAPAFLGRPTRRPSPRGLVRRAQAGFTLVEIILAIALSTLVLLASAVFVFAAFNLLTQTQNDPGIEHHKLGVVGYLEYAFSQAPPSTGNTTGNTTNTSGGAGFPTASTGGNTNGNTTGNSTAGSPALSFGSGALGGIGTGSSNQTTQVSWGSPPGMISIDNPYLSFRVDDDDPLLVWDSGPRPPATAWLYFKEGEGLSIIWQTDQQKLIDPSAMQRTLLSPLVTKMGFEYYDPSTMQWSEADTPPTDANGNQLLPTFIRLTFKINGKEEVMTVNLPTSTSSVPIY
jgi:prepilin-type N-terminal cleavage/methylation domain-containing protein